MKKITKYRGKMKIDTQEVVNLKFTTSLNVIRNPLRSLLMKIVEKVAVTATFSTIFNLSGHS